jgi:excinuclease UvrABC nuclease subunit
MATKKVKYKENDIEKLPNNKPVVYKILTDGGTNNYTGIAKRGRVQDRIKEHLGEIPGATVQIEQMKTITEAKAKESNIITRTKPKYNKVGK